MKSSFENLEFKSLFEIASNFEENSQEDLILNRWAELCAGCFIDKTNPPSVQYFLNHYYIDDSISKNNMKGIFVAIDNLTGNMISSVRVYHRVIHTHFIDNNKKKTVHAELEDSPKFVQKENIEIKD